MRDKSKEIPSIRKLLDDLEQLSEIKSALPILKSQLAEADGGAIVERLESVDQIQREVIGLSKTLVRFNELFAPHGWIAYDWLDVRVCREAIAAVESGDHALAESLLVEYYNPAQVAVHLKTLWSLEAFRPRLRLAELALIDFGEGRYHACIPVVLALIDGMVNDLGNLGFFSENVDLKAWDSFAAHNNGLSELKRLLFKQRSKTTTESIGLPYRNGILHGMDLAYDTPMVAAKCWAALFATADWARQIEKGKRLPPPPENEPTCKQIRAQRKQQIEEQAQMDAWKPREAVDLVNLLPGSPEAALSAFLSAWKRRNFGVMAGLLGAPDGKPLNTRAGEVRRYYEDLMLQKFTIRAVNDKAPAVSEIEVLGSGSGFDGLGTFHLVHFDESGFPVIRGSQGGAWFVMRWNPWQ